MSQSPKPKAVFQNQINKNNKACCEVRQTRHREGGGGKGLDLVGELRTNKPFSERYLHFLKALKVDIGLAFNHAPWRVCAAFVVITSPDHGGEMIMREREI